MQLLVVGSPCTARSEIGLSLARHLHRPFLDVTDPSDVGGADQSSLRSAEIDRLDHLMAVSTAAVIAAPRVVLELDGHDGDGVGGEIGRWILLVEDDSTGGSTDELSGYADAVLPSSMPIDESAIVRLVAEFRDASRRTPD